jgi:hypothetical protein
MPRKVNEWRGKTPDTRAALEGMVVEWDKMTRHGSPLAKQANENLRRARSVLEEKQ